MLTLSNNRKNLLVVSLIMLQIVIKRRQKKKLQDKRKWSRKWILRRNETVDQNKGANNVIALLQKEIAQEDPYDYTNYMRMNLETFNLLLGILSPTLMKQDTNMRQAIPPAHRLIATLRYLATGATLKTLALSMRIPHNTLSVIINEVLLAIVSQMGQKYLKVPNTAQEWKRIASEYEQLWNFPHCIGAIDGKHITFRPFRKDGSLFRNYKNTDSIVLLGVVDANYKFIMVDIGTNGRISDGGVFSRSPISSALENNTLSLPHSSPLPGRHINVPYVLVGDDAFPLKEYIMKPYRYHGLTNEQKVYNYRVSRARRMIESSFGILCNRFQIFLKHMNLSVDKVQLVTHAAVILHNFLVTTCHNYIDQSDINVNVKVQSVPRQYYGNRNTLRSRVIRQEFQDYFNTNGAVHWQQDCVDRHNL